MAYYFPGSNSSAIFPFRDQRRRALMAKPEGSTIPLDARDKIGRVSSTPLSSLVSGMKQSLQERSRPLTIEKRHAHSVMSWRRNGLVRLTLRIIVHYILSAGRCRLHRNDESLCPRFVVVVKPANVKREDIRFAILEGTRQYRAFEKGGLEMSGTSSLSLST